MKKNLKLKGKCKQKGITLIALVITIIVLIILAGVTVATLTGENGILKNATKAKEETESTSTQEKISMAWQSLITKRQLSNISDPISDNELKEQLVMEGENADNLDVTGGTGTLTVKYKDTEITYVVTQEGEIKENNLSNIVQIGDYIEYNPGEDHSYVSYGHTDSQDIGNGVKDYTFTSSNNTKWRVWDITEDGKVRIISEDILYTNGLTGEELCFNGKNGWKQASNELNKICSIYGYGEGAESATSINEEDIKKIVEWTEPDSSTGKYYGNTFTYYSNHSENTFDNTIGQYTVFEMLDGRIPTDDNPIVIENHMWRPLINKESLKVEESKKDTISTLLKGNYKGTNQWEFLYWISGNQPYYGINDFVMYNVYSMISRLEVGSTTVTRTDRNDGDFIKMGIRPIVTLNKNLKYQSGSGKEGDAINYLE